MIQLLNGVSVHCGAVYRLIPLLRVPFPAFVQLLRSPPLLIFQPSVHFILSELVSPFC